MKMRIRNALVVLPFFGLLTACSTTADKSVPLAPDLAAAALPLDVLSADVSTVDGHRAVFLKLTRVPDQVLATAETDPPQIALEIKGPTGEQREEEVVTGSDDVVNRIRVRRDYGKIHVSIDLAGGSAPEYSVHPMADWLMVRILKD